MDVLFSKSSLKQLARCESKTRAVIVEAICGLPDRGDIARLKGQIIRNTFRLRVGRYRVIYTWEGDEIRIIEIDTRGDIYK